MNGAVDAPGEEKNVVSVFLTCISCGKVEEIHVFRERGLPRKVYWDCHDCQKNGNAISVEGRQGDGPAGFSRRAVDAPPEGGTAQPGSFRKKP
jgi:hypothetical protein